MDYFTNFCMRQLKNKHWQGICYYKENGKRKQKTKTSKAALKRDAKVELTEWFNHLNELAAAAGGNPIDKTVREVFTEYLLLQFNNNEIEESSYRSQLTGCRHGIFPYIGDIKFHELHRIEIQEWLTQLHKHYKSNTVANYFSIAKKIYNYYDYVGELESNPFKRVKSPKQQGIKNTHLTTEQMNEFILALNDFDEQGGDFWTAVNILMLTGLRRGEVYALRWRDIDFKANTLSVRSAKGAGLGRDYTKAPKNASSRRTMPMLPQLVNVLQVRLERKPPVSPSQFIAGDRNLSWFSHEFIKFTRQYDLVDYQGHYVTPHSLRHNFATLGIQSGIDVKSMSHLLGHSNAALTLNVYAESDEMAMRQSVDMLSNVLAEETEVYEI